MASILNPYISFAGSARQAMEFYQRIFGGSLTVNTFGEYGTDDPAIADQIMHSMLVTDRGFTIMASDTPPGMQHNPGDNISISLSGEEADDLHRYWDELSAGGTVTVPMAKQMWGDEFGSCVDQFGIPWLVNITQPQS
ncbi:MAG: VOC family protein [Micromonosporaceae bacterium]